MLFIFMVPLLFCVLWGSSNHDLSFSELDINIPIGDYFEQLELAEEEEHARICIQDETALATADMLNLCIHEHFAHLIISPYFPRSHSNQDLVTMLSSSFYLHSILSFRLNIPNNTSFFTFVASEIMKNRCYSILPKIQLLHKCYCVLYNILFNRDTYMLTPVDIGNPLITFIFNKTLLHHASSKQNLPPLTQQWFTTALDCMLISDKINISQHYFLLYKNKRHYQNNKKLYQYFLKLERSYRNIYQTDLIDRYYNIYLPHVMQTHKEHNRVTLKNPGEVLTYYKKFHVKQLSLPPTPHSIEQLAAEDFAENLVDDQQSIMITSGLDYMNTSGHFDDQDAGSDDDDSKMECSTNFS